MPTSPLRPLLGSLLLLTGPLLAQATFSLDNSTYAVGEMVTASWTGSTSPTDWVGIYPQGVTPDGDPVSTAWQYVSGAAGSVVFETPAQFGAGQWSAWLLANDGYGVMPGTAPFNFEVVNPATSIVTFTADVTPDALLSGTEAVVLTWELANPKMATSLMLDDGINPPVDVLGETDYEFTPTHTTRCTLNLDDGTEISVLQIMVVAENSAAFSIESASIPGNGELAVTWAGAAGGDTDWIGVYRVGDTPGPIASTQWNYLTGSQVAGPAPADGSMTFTGLAPGDYFVALLLDDGYEIAEGPILFTVTEPVVIQIPVTAVAWTGNSADGYALEFTWQSKAGYEYDIYASNSLEGDPFFDWELLEIAWPTEGDDTTSYTENLGTAPPSQRFYKVFEFESF